MEITINEKIITVRRLPYNKISNMIYIVNYNLLLNILNSFFIKKRKFSTQCYFINELLVTLEIYVGLFSITKLMQCKRGNFCVCVESGN